MSKRQPSRPPGRRRSAPPPAEEREEGAAPDPDEHLEEIIRRTGLRRVEVEDLEIVRRRAGRGFYYLDASGSRIRDPDTLARIRSLAVPPAYRDVRIAADERAHIQAVGRDEAGRLQHRYHPDWERVREELKAERLARVIGALPRIRRAVRRDMASARLGKIKALACAVALIDGAHIRVGSEAYARENGSRGAATLLKSDVAVRGSRIELCFRGKGGRRITCRVDDPDLARAIRRVASLPGRRLLQYARGSGRPRPVKADEVNAYLRRVSGMAITAKDLRTLAASAAAAERLLEIEPAGSRTARRRQLAGVMREVSERLANTPAVVRKSYVHEVVVQAFSTGSLREAYEAAHAGGNRRRIEDTLRHLIEGPPEERGA